MLVILLRRSAQVRSPKLCSITEHIPIRLDNKFLTHDIISLLVIAPLRCAIT